MLNKAILVGRLTADPELRQTPNGISVISFSIACNRPYSRGGERQTDFINIVAWRSTAEFVAKYFHKGNAIAIDGSIQTRNYTDKDGNKRTAVEVQADNVSFVESKSAASASMSMTSSSTQPIAPSPVMSQNENLSYSSGSAGDFEEIDSDDDLPF